VYDVKNLQIMYIYCADQSCDERIFVGL